MRLLRNQNFNLKLSKSDLATICLICDQPHSSSQHVLSSCSRGCFSASFNSSSCLISPMPLWASAPSSPSNSFKTNNATIPPIATSTALRKMSLPGNISSWFLSTTRNALTVWSFHRQQAEEPNKPNRRWALYRNYIDSCQSKPLSFQ